jgi:tetratricopeptide (TPR) repeat protein
MRKVLVVLSLAAVAGTPSALLAADPCTDPGNVSKANDALSLARKKRYPEAETASGAVLAACGTQPVAVQAMGQAVVGQKRYDDAVKRLTTALSAKPDLAYAYLWRGYAYYYKKMPDKMVSDFETFLKLAPNAPEAATVKQLLSSLKR